MLYLTYYCKITDIVAKGWYTLINCLKCIIQLTGLMPGFLFKSSPTSVRVFYHPVRKDVRFRESKFVLTHYQNLL